MPEENACGSQGKPGDAIQAVLRLAGLLRRGGCPVGPSEIVDALQALTWVDWSRRGQVRQALAATLVKRAAHRPLFEKSFDLVFADPQRQQKQVQQYLARAEQREQAHRRAQEDLGLPLSYEDSQAYWRLPEAERRRLRSFARQSPVQRQPGSPLGNFLARAVQSRLALWRRQLADPAAPEELPPPGDPLLEALWAQLQPSRTEPGGQPADKAALEGALQRDLAQLNPEELPHFHRLARTAARRMATGLSRRYRQSARRRQALDFRRTARASIQHGGVMLQRHYRSRRASRPDLLLLCDVSGSMARYARFVIQFLYGVAKEVHGLRVFLFAEDLEPAPAHQIADGPLSVAASRVMASSRQWGEGTHLGRALLTLRREYPHAVGPRTVVLILSDGRTMALDQAVREVARLRRRCRQIVWLNPLPRQQWPRFPAVRRLRPWCRLFECSTLGHLSSLVQHGLGRRA